MAHRLKFDFEITLRDIIHIIVWIILLTAGIVAYRDSMAARDNSLGKKVEAVQSSEAKVLKDLNQIKQTQNQVQVYLSTKDPHYWRIVENTKLTPGPRKPVYRLNRFH